ncbi:DUF4190 domain-containing protein [Microbacterium fluvii]|uniref:DUF4190 domain-containing protein n=1 Tax=Microbacterium fluvii TaxID=415215 RepID=A0ABW2HE28_9MICO|nr:DUF4190 domain-containing protein [Microbacterium fluvii]MCU4671611.1 DUF4190 domain-containing protein [Microbacterium fluvii]
MTDPQNPADQPPAYTPPPAADSTLYPQQAYAPAPPSYDQGPSTTYPGKTMGIVAFILSFFVSVVALILGIVALVQSRKAGQKNGWAVAAIVLSAIFIVVGTIVLIAFIAFFASAGGDLVNQVNACLDDPTGTVVYNGVTMSCQEILEQSGQ